MKTIGILTSGGDAPGMNATIHAIVSMAKARGLVPLGIMKGYAGLIAGRVEEINLAIVESIVGRGGTILKTSRCEEMLTKEGQEQAVRVLRAFGIEGLIVIGGDGSFKGAREISHLGVPTIGIPGTIDNDLAYTDYTIGFDTAVNYVVGELANVRDTMISHERIGVVEVMGNKCGDIALYAGMASDAEMILVPEVPYDIDEMCGILQSRSIQGAHTSIIVVSEGAGKAEVISNYIRENTHLDVKPVVLGYVQRGGSPSIFDRIIAAKMGIRAVDLLMQGKKDRVVGIRDNHIIDDDINEALVCKKRFDRKMYENQMKMQGR